MQEREITQIPVEGSINFKTRYFMKKFRKMISTLALSLSLMLTGCSGTLNPPMPGAGGQQETQAAQTTQAAQGTTRENGTAAPDTRNVSQSNVKTPTMDLNGYSVTVSDAVYCLTDNGNLVMMSGEYDGAYVLLMFAATTEFKANTSFSRSGFGSTMEMTAVLAEPSSGLAAADSTASGITTASFSVTDISDSGMNVSMSATLNAFDSAFNINASGTVTLSDLDTCTRIFNDFDDLVASAQSAADSNRQPFTCTGCKGSLKCRHCGGDGICSVCLGLLDHCLSCGGSHICQYCGGNGICSYCNGEGVMY